MPPGLYDLPNALLGLLICSGWVLIGVGGFFVFHRVWRIDFAEGEKNLAIALLAVIATMNSLLLAFSAISVWESYGSADKAVRGEAITIGALARNLAVFDTAQASDARDLLSRYAHTVVDDEWQAMRRGERSDAAWTAFEQVFVAVGHMSPANAHESTLMPQTWALTNELLRYRRERLYASDAEVPATLWLVVLAGSLLTIATTYVVPRTAFNTFAVGMLSLSIGLVFFFIVAMDHPFAGTEGIASTPFESVLRKMERWVDSQHPVPPGATTGAAKP